MNKQNTDNAEANKNLPELQKKLAEKIVIHEAKPPRKEEGAGAEPVVGEEPKPREEKKHEDRPPRTFGDKKPHKAIESEEEDDGFEQVTEDDKKRGEARRGGARGGRGRGGFSRGGGEEKEHREHKEIHERKPREEKHKPVEGQAKPQVPEPVKQVVIPEKAAAFHGWGAVNI